MNYTLQYNQTSANNEYSPSTVLPGIGNYFHPIGCFNVSQLLLVLCTECTMGHHILPIEMINCPINAIYLQSRRQHYLMPQCHRSHQ
jgi:hypothetical protein